MRARSLVCLITCLLIVGDILAAPEHNSGQLGNELLGGDVNTGKASDRLAGYQNVQAAHANTLNVQAAPTDTDTNKFNVFHNYSVGLGDLLSVLNDHNIDWRTHRRTPPSTLGTTDYHQASHVSENDIHGLFAFVATMNRWSDHFLRFEHNTQISGDTSSEQHTDLSSAAKESNPPFRMDAGDAEMKPLESGAGISASTLNITEVKSHPDLVVLKTAMEDLIRVFDKYFHVMSKKSGEPTSVANTEDGIMALIATLESLVRGHKTFTNNLPNQHHLSGSSDLNSQDNHAGLQKIVQELKKLVYNPAESMQEVVNEQILVNLTTTTTAATTTTTTTTHLQGGNWEPRAEVQPQHTKPEKKARNLPCEAPFEEIAYRMCILQETTHKLSWAAARDYCRKRGAELAQDAVVIKARRYFNTLHGESGSRVRWPIWVGGRETQEGGARVWRWEDGSAVPTFIWSDGQPRSFTLQQAPDGTCMFLDGYKSFYAASLPCHLKRRFVCQRRD